MINFIEVSKEAPYIELEKKYNDALKLHQKKIEAIIISSYSNSSNEVNSRFVNLKFVEKEDFIFFSNYESPKAEEFSNHNQISALIYWNTINTQIRMKAFIKKTTKKFNSTYFFNREDKKNAVSISSNQSKPIDSFDDVIKNYNHSLKFDNLKECPEYWGGYSFSPYYFEFWEGDDSRLNKRKVFQIKNNCWKSNIIQP